MSAFIRVENVIISVDDIVMVVPSLAAKVEDYYSEADCTIYLRSGATIDTELSAMAIELLLSDATKGAVFQ